MIHLPRFSYALKPWKNGLGMTEEIFVYSGGENEFLFRVSMAALSTSGPFSHYPGVDRTLVLLEGKSVELNDRIVPLFSPVSFPGEDKIYATVEAEGRDFNLMCRRGKVAGKVEVLSGEVTIDPAFEWNLIFALAETRVGVTLLRQYDACLFSPGAPQTRISGERFLCVRVKEIPANEVVCRNPV